MATWYLREEILPLLYAHGGDPTTRALIEVVAEVEQDVGWMAYDAGQQYLATGYSPRRWAWPMWPGTGFSAGGSSPQ